MLFFYSKIFKNGDSIRWDGIEYLQVIHLTNRLYPEYLKSSQNETARKQPIKWGTVQKTWTDICVIYEDEEEHERDAHYH